MTDTKAYRAALARCQSPIEVKMLDALRWMRPTCLDQTVRGCVLSDHPHMHVSSQFRSRPTAPYVLDFAVIVSIPFCTPIRVDVECDGHEFHAMSKEQVKRDLRRNRHLLNLGWNVERFSGSEIFEDANVCAQQVARTIDREFVNMIRLGAERAA